MSPPPLVQMNGPGSASGRSIKSSMPAASFGALVNKPWRSGRSVTSRKNRSTALSHGAAAGAKRRLNRLCFASHSRTAGCRCAAPLSAIRCSVMFLGVSRSTRRRNFNHGTWRCRVCPGATTVPSSALSAANSPAKSFGRSLRCALAVRPFFLAGAGCAGSGADACFAPSRHSTRACSGGDRYRPTMSSGSAENMASVEGSAPRGTWGFKPFARQWRETLAALMSSAAAMLRALQVLPATGPGCLVIRARRARSTAPGGAPRGKSRSMPASLKCA